VSIKSSNTIRVGLLSGFSKSGTPFTNVTFSSWYGALFPLWHHTIFVNTMSQSCSLNSSRRITKVVFPQLLGPATSIVNGCCSLNVIIWDEICLVWGNNIYLIPVWKRVKAVNMPAFLKNEFVLFRFRF
jgi:hypothetical protein